MKTCRSLYRLCLWLHHLLAIHPEIVTFTFYTAFLILKTEIMVVLFSNGNAIESKWINPGKIPFWKYII